MNVTGVECFDQLNELHYQSTSIKDKYPKLRSLLERVCKDMTAGDPIQFSNLFSRLNYVCKKTKLPSRRTYQINTFRVNANNVLYAQFDPSEEDYLHDLKALCNVVSHFYDVPIPEYIAILLPEIDLYKPAQRIKGEKHERIRVDVLYVDDEYIYAFAEKMPTEDPVRIKYNEEFAPTVERLWTDCQLNLIDVTIDDHGILFPDMIILEPDYLIDISSLAECLKEYGSHPLNYVQSRFEATKNTSHILLGNAANLFLDEFVNEKPHEPVVYKTAMKKAFKAAPLEFATCADLNSKEKVFTFFESTVEQFNNIQKVVNNVFPSRGIDREYGILEPAFMCEHLGVQGRLDYLQLNTDKQFVIELKSGKAPSPDTNFELIGKNHKAQAFIYQIIIQKILGVSFKNLDTLIFYSKYADEQANLRLSQPFMAVIKEILNIRNLIVADERTIAADHAGNATKAQIDEISPETLITNNQLNENFLNRFIVPQINHFKSFFNNSSVTESAYFHSFYTFVTREHYISKTGGADYEGSKGISSLWLSTLDEKMESGEILTDLTILENNTEKIPSTVTLTIPVYDDNFLPNFRQGDIVILYQRNNQEDNVTNKQIFKGAIEALHHNEITIRLRQQQRNQSVLPVDSKYAVEHDFLDSAYSIMYRGLYAFLQANADRKTLLLNQRPPMLHAGDLPVVATRHSAEVDDIVRKAKHARDYFLLVGPPGTGKTSIALKEMVKEFYKMGCSILLLSYTNRAVDEICDSLDTIEDAPAYIRIGSSLSCDPKHRDRLLDKAIADCDSRELVKLRVQQYRIFVGTVAAVSGRMELFRIKHFQVAIIDEASQILEPHLLGILSAKNGKGTNAIDKFILIGDHKQLPAVVLQKPIESQVNDPHLHAMGLYDRRNSLFERLFSLHKDDKNSPFWGMLHKQGRMHPDIALFPNYAFYNGELKEVPCAHQKAPIEFKQYGSDAIQTLIATKRLAFIPSERNSNEKTNKTNSHEAAITAMLLKNIYALYELNGIVFSPEESVGIITPYRSQIALIRREIIKLGIPILNQLTIDTVERFQGSQRDIIIYSFSVNQFYQIDFLSNNMEENGMLVDRKLNVAITRAKKQLFITGNPAILSNNITYFRLIEFIRSKGGYLSVRPSQFLSGKFAAEKPAVVDTPDETFTAVFNSLVVIPVKNHPATKPPSLIYGNDHDYNKLCVTEYGRTNFDLQTKYSSQEKVDLYCYYNMRQQYCSVMEFFTSSFDFFTTTFSDTSNRISFIDLGCGPLTSGLAFNKTFSSANRFHFHYIGIDISVAMLSKAREFANSGLFDNDTTFLLKHSLEDINADYWDSTFCFSNTVILNFSHQFANMGKEDVEKLATGINNLLDKYPLNKYIIAATDRQNRMYHIFRRLVPRLNDQD